MTTPLQRANAPPKNSIEFGDMTPLIRLRQPRQTIADDFRVAVLSSAAGTEPTAVESTLFR
jgi:hypothetical protein